MMLDSVIRAPLIGSMLMALVASLIGVLLFVRRRTLLGETLSHASYPGVTLAILLSGLVQREWLILLIALISSLLGYALINFLIKRMKVREDSALSFTLATFFGMGTLLASIVQRVRPAEFRQVQLFLYGQAATMSDGHILFYALYAALVLFLLIVFYRPLLLLSFDPLFSKTSSFRSKGVEILFFILVTSSVVIAIRCVGVIMMAALFIAPPVAARGFTHNLWAMMLLAAVFGMVSGFLGTLLSLSGLPTGPLIVLIACSFAFLSLLFAPKRGVIARYFRIIRFRTQCAEENLLKALWHQKQAVLNPWYRLTFKLKGWTSADGSLSREGERRAAKVVRAHRLWEAYLVYSLGMGVTQVHHSAEEMEHHLTPELEEQLIKLMGDPKEDPHAKPIPPREQVFA